ncbi:hypothetical protein GCM10009678_39980 [Actinomadura kijaniata]|uniref:phospholipase D n=1 Tax=Actinomadura namibiensis TaxID=182080 RepID=A0A7W3LUC9_ACTNM|nr:phospholipase D-like domain-containing protein [Actinomadura namibiensis]MBA8954454.1 phosphatidylserine/phosphatidylglycerophosphate/cardiolipin synthase-like enzyme [Actinomadura namibiensis]
MRGFVIAAGGSLVALAVGSVDATAAVNGNVTRVAHAAPQAVAKAKPKKPKKRYVPQGVRFNLPTGTTAQRGAIDLYIKKLIRNAPRGSEIDVSLFRLRTPGMAKELVRAHKRRVKVRIILDSDSPTGGKTNRAVYDYLRRNLGTSTRRSSWVVLCPTRRGCVATAPKGKWSKNHNKFYAFSRTYDSRNVVVQTSSNATNGGYNQYNDAYTVVDRRLYTAYRRYFYDLARKRANANYWRTTWSAHRGVSHFPKATGDPIGDVLDRVSCTGGRTRIRVSSGILTRTGVAGRLTKLDDRGCRVQVVADEIGESAMRTFTKPSRNGIPEVRYFTRGQNRTAHSKYLLIDGIYKGHRRKLVLTGSHSYTTDALRYNDESMLWVFGGHVHDVYVRNFNRVFSAAQGKVYVSGLLAAPTVPDDTSEAERPEPEPATGQPEAELPATERPAPDGGPSGPVDGLPSAEGL